MVLEYCLANVDAGVRDRLRSRADASERGCLERCGRCHDGPFLVVDGGVRDGPTHEAILAAVEDR